MNNFKEKTFWNDETRVCRGLVNLFLFFVAVGIAVYAVRSGKIVMMVGVVILPLAVAMLGRPDLILLGALLADISGLSVPGLRLELSQFLYLLGAFSGVLLSTLKGYRWTMRPERRFMLFFSGVILLLMAVRGTGLRFLGSSTWGGGPYLLILAAVVFSFFYEPVTISSLQIKRLVQLVIPVAVLGGVVQRSGAMRGFEEMVAAAVMDTSSEAAVRIRWYMPIGQALFLLSFLRLSEKKLIRWVCWGLGVGLVAVSGFRGVFVSLLATTMLFEFFRAKNKRDLIFRTLVFGAVIYGAAFVVAPLLPLGLQRALSILPGMESRLDPQMVWSATRSSEWRKEIWAYCWERVPQYLLIGRGITFEVSDVLAHVTGSDIGRTNQWFMYYLHNYHSGPLYLLIDYGFLGFIGFFGIQAAMALVVLRWMSGRTERSGTLLETYTFFICAGLLWKCFGYYAVFGDDQTLIKTLFTIGVLRILLNSVAKEDAELAQREALESDGQSADRSRKVRYQR